MIILLGLLLFFLYITALIGTNSENVRKIISKWFKRLLNEKEGFNTRLITFSIFFILLIGMPILVLILNTQYHFFTFNLEVSEKVGNIMNGATAPVITTLATILTFAAFWVQYQANQMQKEQFKQQMELQKEQFDEQLQEQDKINQRERFESHFFKLIDLHKENVREMKITIKKITRFDEHAPVYVGDSPRLIEINDNKSGMDSFIQFHKELKHIKDILKSSNDALLDSRNSLLQTDGIIQIFDIYKCFFVGMESFYEKHNPEKSNFIHERIKKRRKVLQEGLGIQEGRALELGKYFRLLYHTVKFVADYPSNILSEEEKYQYLKTLRSQLSHQEQLLLLLNSISEWGEVWLTEGYITKYRICKNVWEVDLQTFGIDKKIYDIINEKLTKYPDLQVKDGKNKEGKSVFEF